MILPKKKVKKKKPTGILKDLAELQRIGIGYDGEEIEDNNGWYIRRLDVEAIINKYSNP